MSSGDRPGVALFCATFLKPEMLHIHRHVTGLKDYCPAVITQKCEGDWEAGRIDVVKRSPFRFLSRAREKSTGRPWQITRGEARRMLAIIASSRARILHVFFGNAAVHLLPLLRECPVPVIVSFHGSDVAGSMASAAYADARRELFALAAAVPCRSAHLAERVAALGCPREKLCLMRTILPEIPVHAPRKPPSDGVWRFIQAARLVPKKGLSTAMHAFAAFAEKHPWSTFTIAGEGPMEEELRALAGALRIDDRVEFTGFLSQSALGNLFALSHVFLHPSETANRDVEGVPNAMLEAMAWGLPVVATRHGGIPEVITDGANGLLCAEGDAQDVARAMFRLADEPGLCDRLSRHASESVRAMFSAPAQIAAIESIYGKAILAHPHRKPAEHPAS
ncbi:MAG TPA: glycosyltransferase [Terrimicrobiaceae bacterium]|nr:glycosyltransferase [Terrimicrobiaceae bacterium]